MTTETIPVPVPFIEAAENLNSDNSYNYLLNFWYTSKLNKELDYVKRNGLHPELVFDNSSGTNSFKPNGISPISTLFYTVFRIYLENAFKNFKFTKTRNQEEWLGSFNTEKDYGLDNPTYLKMSYARDVNFNTLNRLLDFPRGGYDPARFRIRLNNLNSLYVDTVSTEIAELEEHLATNINTRLTTEANNLFQKLRGYVELPVGSDEKPVKKATKRTAPVVAPEDPNLRNIVTLYNSMERTIPANFPERTKFSFLLQFARGSGLPVIEDTEENFNNFRAARAA